MACATSDDHPDDELHQLRRAARRDPLTGVANRLELSARLDEALAAFSRDGTSLAVLFLDVDFFKRVNDRRGHSAGDETLVGLAKVLQQECDASDLIARYGGDEFLIVRPRSDATAAQRFAEQLRTGIANTAFGSEGDVQITVSIGIAIVEPGDTSDTLLQRADKALYRAKHAGRNRICLLTTADLQPPTAPQEIVGVDADPFVVRVRLHACLTLETVLIVLGRLLKTEHVVLTDLGPDFAELTFGELGRSTSWGRRSERRPVQVYLRFDDASGNEGGQAIALEVTVRPLGRPPGAESFQSRAREIVDLLERQFMETAGS